MALAGPKARRVLSSVFMLCAALTSTSAWAASAICNEFNTTYYDATYSSGSGLSGSKPNAQAGGEVVTYTWTVRGNGRAYLYIANATRVFNSTSSGSGTFTLPDGDISISYGNNGTGGSVVYTFKCITIPKITSLNPATGSTSGGTSVTISGSDFLSGATVAIGGVPATNVARNSSTSLSFTTPAHAEGVVSVAVTNPGGSAATKANAFTYVVEAPRATTITSLSETMGPVAGGTSVTATGTGFVAGSTSITIGGMVIDAANVNVASATSLSFVTPARAAGNVAVTATVPEGSSDPVAGGFTYIALPTATNMTPTSGTYTGGTTVFVLGSGFVTGKTSVTIGGTVVPASSVTVSNSSFLSFITPPHTGGKVAVTVTTPGGSTSAVPGGFNYTGAPSPTATQLSPTVGGVEGGTEVTVTGTNFVAGNTSVTIGGTVVPANSVTVNSATSLTFNTPAHAAGNVAVTVTTPVGTTGAVPGGFTYAAVPEITSISRNSAPLAGNVSVIITGSGFSMAAASGAVKFGANDASYTINGDTQITATAPAGSAGAVNIRVTTPGGTSAASGADQFTYHAAPVAAGQDFVVPARTSTPLNLSDAITGNRTSIEITAEPANGSVSVNGDTVTYTPNIDYAGPDSFGYKAIGEGGSSLPATVTLTVEPAAQTITFGPLPDASLSASPLTLSATAESGGVVSFASTTSMICSVAGTALTLHQMGTCTVQADQPGGGSWAAALPVSQSFTVTPANLVVAAGPASGTSVGANYGQSNTASGGIGPYTYSVDPSALPPGTTLDSSSGTVSGTPTTAGLFPYQVEATDSQGTPVRATGDLVNVTIAKGNQTVSFTTLPPAAAVGGMPYTIGAIASSTLAVNYSLDGASAGCSLSGNTLTFLATGTCRVNADQPGDANWNAAPQKQQAFAIGEAGAVTANINFTPTSLAAGATGTMTITFNNPNVSSTPSFNALLTAPAIVAQVSGGSGGTCSVGSTSPNGDTVQFGNIVVPSGSCTVTLNYRGAAAGSTSGFTLGSFTPSGYPTTSATTSNSFVVLPTATAISPDAGPVSQVVTITGTGFSTTPGNNLVSFGSAPGTVTGATETSLTVTAPATGSGPVAVTVSVDGQVTASSMTYTFIDKPIAANRSDVAVPYASTGTAIDLSASITGGPHDSIEIETDPAHGMVSIAGDVVTYTPVATYFGADSFTYVAVGPGGTSAPATVSLAVATPPVPGVADKNGVAVAYGSGGTAIDLSSSVTGVHSGITIATEPAHGTVSVSGYVVTYIPASDYYGTDSFTYTATGSGGTSAPATVELIVATPAAPIAASGASTVAGRATSADGSVVIDLSALVSGVYDTIQIQTPPAHGTVVLGGGSSGAMSRAAAAAPVTATYTPEVAFAGDDSFTFVAVGPGGTSAPGTITITVVGEVPTAQAKTAATGDGQTISVMLTDGATGGPFTGANVVSVSPAGSATTAIVASGSGESATYRLDVTPNNRFGGTIVVTYTLSNTFGASAPSTVTLTVEARPDPRSDPNVAALSDAQAEVTRRFSRTQVSNFMRRNEQLHRGGGRAGMAMGLRLGSRDPARWQDPEDEDWGTSSTKGMRLAGESSEISHDTRGSGSARNAEGFQAASNAADGGKRRTGSLAGWVGGAIEIGTRDATTNRSKITATTAGLSGGVDIKLAEGVIVGLGGGYGDDTSNIGTAARVRSQSTIYAAYASIQPAESIFIDGMVGRGQLDFSTRRIVQAMNSTATGKRDGNYTVGALSLGVDQVSGPLQWSLYGRGEYMDANLKAYVETGADRYNLRFDARSVESLTGTIGGTLQYRHEVGFGSITPHFRAEWSHEFADVDAQWLDYADIPGEAIYEIEGSGWTREQFQISLGARLDLLKGGWSIDLETTLRAAAAERAASVQARISKEF